MYRFRNGKSTSIMIEDRTIKQALVGLAIETALLDVGKPTLKEVIRKLESYYNCGIFDCYYNPELLVSVLRKLYGNSYGAIVESIKKNLVEFSHQEPISRFILELTLSSRAGVFSSSIADTQKSQLINRQGDRVTN